MLSLKQKKILKIKRFTSGDRIYLTKRRKLKLRLVKGCIRYLAINKVYLIIRNGENWWSVDFRIQVFILKLHTPNTRLSLTIWLYFVINYSGLTRIRFKPNRILDSVSVLNPYKLWIQYPPCCHRDFVEKKSLWLTLVV